ncbi:MAG: hypothetical protein ACPGO3_02355 [Magnetospiraceae bacterium]
MMAPKYCHRRGGSWYYIRRVPRRARQVDPRKFVKIPLKDIDDARLPAAASAVNDLVEAYWADLVALDGTAARARYEAALRLARAHGFAYRPLAALIADGVGVDDLVARLAAIDGATGGAANAPLARALVGTVPPPALTIRGALEDYWRLSADRNIGKNADQIRRWKNPRIKAVNNLVVVLDRGDFPLASVTRDDALTFRAWWIDRMRDEGLTADSANKDIGCLSHMVRTVSEGLRLGLDNVFAGLRVEDSAPQSRDSFEPDYVQNVLLLGDALAGLNDQARAVVWVMADTGAGVNEISGLATDDIHLDAGIPHILIRPNDFRSLKTAYRRRRIPLVGAALAALQEHPAGFPHYQGKNVLLSATIGKFFRENGLYPTDRHSLYSLRHTFQDRMTAAEIPEIGMASLMGHKFHRPRYGGEIPLEQAQGWLEKIAFRV